MRSSSPREPDLGSFAWRGKAATSSTFYAGSPRDVKLNFAKFVDVLRWFAGWPTATFSVETWHQAIIHPERVRSGKVLFPKSAAATPDPLVGSIRSRYRIGPAPAAHRDRRIDAAW